MFCGAVSADSAVESSNIVGYSTQLTAVEGYAPFTPNFTSVSNDEVFNLSDIAGEFSLYDSIQIFGAGGDVEIEYVWRKVGGVLGWWYETDDGWISAANATINRGTSFWFSTSDAIDVTVSGAVAKKAFETTFNEGYTPTGNPMAIPVKISEIEFSDQSLYDSIQVFGNGGDVDTEYVWRKVGGVLGWWYETDDGWVSAADVVLQPGQAFWYSAISDGVTMKINPPSL